jgi:preprotein translocase subunit SecA
MLGFLRKFSSGKRLKDLETTVEEINKLEPEVQKLTDEELKERSRLLKERVQKGETLEDVLPEAFALAREAAKRTLGQRPFDVQLMGGITLHSRGISEMVTGEGKTLAAVSPAYLNSLAGKGVHVVTVNEYLARRDAVWMGQIYHALGMSVGCLVPNAAYIYDPTHIPETEAPLVDRERDTTGSFLVQTKFLRPISRREAYLTDITYGTNHEFGFDYLRDNLTQNTGDQVQRGHHYAIIDEVDSILIDEARTPLIVAAPDAESSQSYKLFARVVGRLEKDVDFAVDEKFRSVSINEAGIEKVEKIIGVQNIYAPENFRLVHYLEESLKAKALFHRDKDYVVKQNEVIIVDEFTGRMLLGRRYSGGLHQAIEAKEGVLVKEESRTYAKISIQNYFRLYEKIAGMTGTAQTSAEEFYKVYNLDVVSIPTNKPLVRKNLSDAIYKNLKAKYAAVVNEVKERYGKGQPVLLGTTSIEKNELLSAMLSKAGVSHEVLNAKNNEREGAIIAQAGRLKAVTVATNVAGRGVDIILGGNPPKEEEAQKIKELGGLHVIGTERHEARRIDNQLRGRAGRQGDPGSSQFFLSLEDDFVRIFGGDRIKNLMERFNFPEDQPIQMGMVSKAVEQAQAKVEGAHFDMRKHLLEYDDVLNKQRTAVYKERQRILESVNQEEVAKIVSGAAIEYLEKNIGAQGEVELKKIFEEAKIVTKENQWPIEAEVKAGELNEDEIEKLKELINKRSSEIAGDQMSRSRVLGLLDLLWMNHLDDLEALSESIGLRAYGQKDPLVEYRRESHRLFKDLWQNFNGWIFSNIFKLAQSQAQGTVGVTRSQVPRAPLASGSQKVGRNDPCPCGSGKKYKKCHGK